MKNVLFAALALAAPFLVIPDSASAHHGYAAFDTKATITLQGTVTDFHFVNPHCVIEFDVKAGTGQVVNWKAELSSVNHLTQQGWSESSVQTGDEVTVTGYRAKNGAPSIWVTKIVLPNGTSNTN